MANAISSVPPVVTPSAIPPDRTGISVSLRGVVPAAPERRRAMSGSKSAAESAMPAGTPSMRMPSDGAWDAPQMLMRNIVPKVCMICFVKR